MSKPSSTQDQEHQTQELARRILSEADQTGSDWWLVEDLILDWSVEQPQLKTPLFRLVDVLPALDQGSQVVDHLQAYLHPYRERSQQLPTALNLALAIADQPWFPTRFVSSITHFVVRRLARRFIAGEDEADVTEEAQSLLADGIGVSIDRLGEEVLTQQEVQAYVDDYDRLLDQFQSLSTQATSLERPLSLSLKPTALDEQFDPAARQLTLDRMVRRLEPFLKRARKENVVIYLDMEADETREITLDLIRRLLASDEVVDGTLGLVIQAYHRQARDDLESIIEAAQESNTVPWVRLVKGAYWDVERVRATKNQWDVPVFESKGRTDQQFEELAARLVDAHPAVRVAFGSHNVRSLAWGITQARQADLPDTDWECQLLYGMGRPIRRALTGLDVPLRLYVPYGPLVPGMSYLVRRLLENTANQSFLRQTLQEEETIDVGPPSPDAGQADELKVRGYRTVGPTDYSKRDEAEAQREALAAVRARLDEYWPRWFRGRRQRKGPTIESRNPSAWDETVGHVHGVQETEVESAMGYASDVFSDWRQTDTEQRAGWLQQLAERLEQQRRELTAWIVYEAGKNWREADADVMEAIDFCRYYAEQAIELGEDLEVDWPGQDNTYRYEPKGPTVVIPPWNFPLAITTGMTVAALVTGNPVVLKPSSHTPIIAARLVEEVYDAGLPDGVLQFLPGEGSTVGQALVEDPRTAVVAFTGSRDVGTRLYENIGTVRPNQRHLKTGVLELGGKNAVIVDRDADLDRVVEGVVRSAFGYQGQKCSACSRLILIESEPGGRDELVERLVEATEALRQGPAREAENFLGPVISPKAQKTIRDYKDAAYDQGRVMLDREPPGTVTNSPYVGPMIVDHVDPAGSLANEEIFGPVLSVFRVSSLEAALRLAEDVDYALTGGFYSRHPDRIQRVKDEFRVGNLYINQPITGALVGRQPFGGYRLSGTGTKAGGPDYLKNFTWPRSISEDTTRRGFAPEVLEDQ